MAKLRLATYNAENLFSRPKVMNLATWAEGKPILDDIQKLNDLIVQPVYDDATKTAIVAILVKYGFDKKENPKNPWPFTVNQTRDKLYKKHKGTNELYVSANGRGDWMGWVELTRVDLDEVCIENTGRVVGEVNADVQCLVEIEDRPSLARFNEQVLEDKLKLTPFDHNMLVDGNDSRGIDIGLACRKPYEIVSVSNHIDEPYGNNGLLFSRDCPEFEVKLANKRQLWVLGNHFKSKGYGDAGAAEKRRRAQATRVAEIYAAARERSEYVAVAGDLNDSPDSSCLAPLVTDTDLKDVMSHPTYTGTPGTFDTGKRLDQKLDYILLSPALWSQVKAVGVERRGIYAPRTFAHFDTVTSDDNSASDHAAVWVDLDL
jgi:endonuclease/exonuclease/phosphatase family metal-dependent hydrolase